MSKNGQGPAWLLPLFFVGLAYTAPTLAGERSDKSKDADLEAEAQEAAKEDAQEIADRIAGKKGLHQQRFHGTFLLPSDPSQQTNPDVVGTFVTDDSDPKPNRTYLVKVDKGSKDVLEALVCYDAKRVMVQGKLRNQAKYLVVRSVTESGPTQRVLERRPPGGI